MGSEPPSIAVEPTAKQFGEYVTALSGRDDISERPVFERTYKQPLIVLFGNERALGPRLRGWGPQNRV